MMDAIAEAVPDKRRQVENQRVSLRTLKGRRQVLILGQGKFAKVCWETLLADRAFSRRVIGFVENKIGWTEERLDGLGIVGTIDELPELVETYKVGMIVVCLDDHRSTLPIQMLLDLKVAGIEVIDGHRLFEKVAGRLSIDSLKPSALIFSTGFKRRRMTTIVKRSVDVSLAVLSLLVAAPFLLIVACLIKVDSPGPLFYRQLRVGLKAQPFMMVKFRSMSNDAEENGPRWAEERDPRVSRIGRWLRKWRIDEIPQFLNVLKGEMSIVGPRPERPVFVEELRKTIPYYDIRHTVCPGITGWAQVQFRYAASEEDSNIKLQYDLYYVKKLSIWLDLRILIKTICVVFLLKGSR